MAEQVKVILGAGLKCILCVGEVKEEYDLGLNKEVCALQLAKCLTGVSEADLANVVIAYEPVWAIGTGLTATPEIAEDVHKYIRSWFAKTYSAAAAEAMRIQYGGSVTPETVDELMSQPDIDGALVRHLLAPDPPTGSLMACFWHFSRGSSVVSLWEGGECPMCVLISIF